MSNVDNSTMICQRFVGEVNGPDNFVSTTLNIGRFSNAVDISKYSAARGKMGDMRALLEVAI